MAWTSTHMSFFNASGASALAPVAMDHWGFVGGQGAMASFASSSSGLHLSAAAYGQPFPSSGDYYGTAARAEVLSGPGNADNHFTLSAHTQLLVTGRLYVAAGTGDSNTPRGSQETATADAVIGFTTAAGTVGDSLHAAASTINPGTDDRWYLRDFSLNLNNTGDTELRGTMRLGATSAAWMQTVSTVPEPATALMWAAGLLVGGAASRRRGGRSAGIRGEG